MRDAGSMLVLVPGRLPGLPRRDDLVIRDGVDKLRAVYGGSPEAVQGWIAFESYGATRARVDPTWPNRLAAGDVGAPSLVGEAFAPRQVDAMLAPDARDSADAALAAVPTDWSLTDPLPPEAWRRIERLLRVLAVPGLDLRRTTRLGCLKRPRLLPLVPSDGRAPRSGSVAEVALESTRRLAEVIVRNQTSLSEMAAGLNAWLEGRTPHYARIRVGPARVLSELIAFELGGYRRFAGWEARGGEVRRRGEGAAAGGRRALSRGER
ncbi:MAG TPA: DUF6308 family protein [Anaeromyxobacteraceae bacterium]|nr:DUF6308 family protein [Anaeromyxobacteraceae bacterium]